MAKKRRGGVGSNQHIHKPSNSDFKEHGLRPELSTPARSNKSSVASESDSAKPTATLIAEASSAYHNFVGDMESGKATPKTMEDSARRLGRAKDALRRKHPGPYGMLIFEGLSRIAISEQDPESMNDTEHELARDYSLLVSDACETDPTARMDTDKLVSVMHRIVNQEAACSTKPATPLTAADQENTALGIRYSALHAQCSRPGAKPELLREFKACTEQLNEEVVEKMNL